MNVSLCSSPLKTFLMGALLVGSSIAHARYGVMDYRNKGMDPNKRTHIIVAGKGSDMGLQFHMSAAAQARKIQDVNPDDQVVLVAVLDDGKKTWIESIGSDINEERRMEMSLIMAGLVNQDKPEDVQKYGNRYSNYYRGNVVDGTKAGLKQWGFTNIQEYGEDLDGNALVGQMARFRQIASLNIYSHSTAYYGLILDGPMKRLDPEDAKLAQDLKYRFTSDAYAWLHGCNNGILGMKFTSKWGIPVATSFTSTAFQELFKKKDGTLEFVHGYDGNVPAGAGRVGKNTISYAKTQTCSNVPCVRMMPDNYGYNGYWGNFKDGGLGFYKFNCSSHVNPEKCKIGMAVGLINQIANVYSNYEGDLETFKTAAKDHLCPTGVRYVKSGYTVQNCYETLERALTDRSVTLDTFMTKSLQCDRRTCNASIKCMAIEDNPFFKMFTKENLLMQKSCAITNRSNPYQANSTQVQEYRDLVDGFRLMKQAKGLPL